MIHFFYSDRKENNTNGNFAQSACEFRNRQTQSLQERREHANLQIPGPEEPGDADMDTIYLSNSISRVSKQRHSLSVLILICDVSCLQTVRWS